MSKRTLLLIVLLAATTGLLVMLALKTETPPPPTQNIQAAPTPSAQSHLFFGTLSTIPSSPSSKLTYSLPVLLSTGANKVTAVQLELQYDPKVLDNISVTPGPFFQNPVVLLNKIEEKLGRISYALGIPPQGNGRQGADTVAVLSFEKKSGITPTQTSIQFLPKSLVTAEGILESVLTSTDSAQFVVGQ